MYSAADGVSHRYKDMSVPYNQVTTNTSTSPSSLQFSSLNPSYMNNPVGGIPAVPVHKQSEGPDGANLFIYHIPPGELGAVIPLTLIVGGE